MPHLFLNYHSQAQGEQDFKQSVHSLLGILKTVFTLTSTISRPVLDDETLQKDIVTFNRLRLKRTYQLVKDSINWRRRGTTV